MYLCNSKYSRITDYYQAYLIFCVKFSDNLRLKDNNTLL